MSKKFMIDTSVIIDNPYNLIKLSENGKNKIYITEVVIAELDKHKTSLKTEVAVSAREFFRGMRDSAFRQNGKKLKNKKLGDSFYKVKFAIDNENLTLHVIVRTNYEKQTLQSESSNDAKIREVTQTYGMTCITNDISFKFIAMSQGLKADSIHWDSIESFDDIDFTSRISITEEDFEENRSKIAEGLRKWTQLYVTFVDKDNRETGNRAYYMVDGTDMIEVGDEEYREYEIKPLGIEQKFYLNALASSFNILTVSGSTGSGKTLLALQEGMRRVKSKNSPINGIVYMRFTVNAEDKFSALGYRKGNDEQKLDRFNLPLYSAINFIADQRITKNRTGLEKDNVLTMQKNEMTESIIRDYGIEFLDISSARGITIENKFVIFDEVQNAPNTIVRLIGTRLGGNSKLVLMGDPGQVDHPYLSKHRNGLITMLKASMQEGLDAYTTGVKLTKTVRSETSKWFEENVIG